MFWILLTLSLVCADKLDRTYLPPSGAENSGGRAGDIQVPFEYPISEYQDNNEGVGNKDIAIGIDRIGPKQILEAQKYINSENSVPRFNEIITQSKPNNFNSTYITSSIDSDRNPDYIDDDSSTVNISNDQKQKLYNNGPGRQVPEGESFSTLKPSVNIISSSTPFLVSTPKYSEPFSPNNLPVNIDASFPNYSSTTKKPADINSLYHTNVKRPESIQAQADRESVILNCENILTPEGYAYSFDTSNGIHGDESGIAVDGVKAKGSYSYIGDDGKQYSVVYTADENGFRPQGDHIPTPPPIPEAILKVIEKAYEDKKAGIFDDGSYDENKYGFKKYLNNPYDAKIYNNINIQRKNNDSFNPRNNFPITSVQEKVNSESPQISGNHAKNTSQIQNKNTNENLNLGMLKDLEESLKNIKEGLKDANTSLDNKDFNNFPSRFSETLNNRNENEKVTNIAPKPFMTPYVSRSDGEDERESSESSEKTFEEPRRYFSDGSSQKNYDTTYKYQKEDNDSGEVVDFSDISDNNFKMTNNGYFYPKFTSNSGIFSQYFNPYLPSPRNEPYEFPIRSTTKSFDQFYSDAPKSTSSPNKPTIGGDNLENAFPTFFPRYSTTNPNIVGEISDVPTPNNFNNAYDKNIKKLENMPTRSSLIPELRASYSPNLDFTISDYRETPSITEKNLKEDFSGPKRPQSFDPLTGYHY